MTTPTVKEQLFDWLRWIVRYEAAISQDYNGRDEVTHAWLQAEPGSPRLTESDLDIILTHRCPLDGDTHALHSWLYLPVPVRGTIRVPLMNVIYDFTAEHDVVGFQVVGYWLVDNFEWRASAWRFECPERPGDDGNISQHAYFHVQPCQGLRTLNGDMQVPYAPSDAQPGDGPTFPLDAADPIDLLICLLIALYGRRQAAELIREAAVPGLGAHLRGLRTMRPPAV